MSEYIEREAAIKARNRSCKRNCAECDFAIEGDSWCEGEVFVVDLLRIPTADVVASDCYDRLLAENDELRKERPVVRCKDCEYWDATQEAPLSEGCFLCTLEGGYPKGDFYCALGERRMDGDGE